MSNNIENLSHEELVRLQSQISEMIAKVETNILSDDKEEVQFRTKVINIPIAANDDSRYGKIQRDSIDSDMDVEEQVRSCNQLLKKPQIKRMSCPPPPPPVKKSVGDMLISPRFTRSNSTESIAVPVPKRRSKLTMKPSKPQIAPKPFIINDNLHKIQNIECKHDSSLSKRKEAYNRTDVTHDKIVLTSRLLKEFNQLRVVDKSGGTLERLRFKNDKKTDEILDNLPGNFTENAKKMDDLRRKLSIENSTRSFPELPPRPSLRGHSFIRPSPTNMINRLSVISNKAKDNIQENDFSEAETSYYSEDKGYKTDKDYDDDDEPIYESIAESVCGPKPRLFKLSTDYQENVVFDTLKRCKNKEVATPPPLPPKPMARLMYGSNARRSDGETESETSSMYSENATAFSFARSDRESVYFNSYPPREGSVTDDFDIDEDTHRKYKEALNRINQSEKIYMEQLEKIFSIYTDNTGRADEDYMKELFGEIKGLMAFHKDFFREFKSCHTLPQLGQLVIRMEHGFDIYIRDQWFKVTSKTTKTTTSKHTSIFMPYLNWTENHLSMYHHLLNQLLDDGDPDLKVASTVIGELIRQCEAIHWLKEITNFPKLQEAGKFLIKDKFGVKVNYMKRGNCDVIFMEKYILCVSPESQECFCHFNTSKISVAKKPLLGPPKSLFIENIFKDKKLSLNSNDPHLIETWYNTYLCLIHKKS